MQSRFAWVRNPFGPPIPVKFDPEETVVKNTLIVYALNNDECESSIDTLVRKYPYKEPE